MEQATFSPDNYPPIPEVAPQKSPHVDVSGTTLERTDDTGNGKGRSKDGGNGRGKGRGKGENRKVTRKKY